MLDTFRIFLEKDPEFHVVPAISAKAALEVLKNGGIDAIVSDYEMPEIDGIGLLKIIRQEYPLLPFIIFTGKGREEIVIESLNNGADYYVRKGGDPRAQFAELGSKLKHAVALRETLEKVARLNRLYLVLSRIGEAIVRIHDRRTLMEEVSTIAVRDGGFIRAWIGFEDPETREVTAMVASGTLDGFFTDVRESVRPLPGGEGLTVAAVRQGRQSVSNDIPADPRMAEWVADARSYGYRAAASFPLTACRKSRGAMTFFSQHPHFFTDAEISLLRELCEDISYALETIDLEASRQKIQSELEQSRRQLVNIINFLPEPTFAIDRSGNVIIWNQAMEIMTGVDAEQVLGKGNFEHSFRILGDRRPALLDMLAEPDENLARHGYTAIARNHRTLKAEVTAADIRGAPAILRLTASPLYDERGQLAGAIESVQNVTRIKKAEEETAENREKYHLLLENVSDSVVVHRPAGSSPGRFIEVNDRACQMLGYSHDELLKMSLADLCIPAEGDHLAAVIQDIHRNRHTVFETQLVAKDGRRIPVEISALMLDLKEKPVVLSIIREIPKNSFSEHASVSV
jgi:PAS domain S-box-containing protein